MNKYKESIKFLVIAGAALLLGFLWTDAFLISFMAFLTFIVMAAQSALAAAKTFDSRVKLMYVFSSLLAILIILGFTVINPPQCPDSYTQKQINAAHGSCIIGANIGIGLYFMFIVIPAAIIVTVLWFKTLFMRKSPKKTSRQI